jgi:hypothetical protein
MTKQRIKLWATHEVTTALIALLDDEDLETVSNITIALGQIFNIGFKDDRAYPRMIVLARSEYKHTFAWAMMAAIKLRDEAALGDILPLCNLKFQPIRERAISELSAWIRYHRKGLPALSAQSIALLRKLANANLNDPVYDVRSSSAQILGEIGNATDLVALREKLARETDIMAQSALADAIAVLEKKSNERS